MSLAYETDLNLGQAIFGHAQLGDQRRTARLVETFNLMQRHPGGTLPDKLSTLADELGQIGRGTNLGYVCQNVLAVTADTGEVLGLVDQILHHRDEAPENETLPQHRERETRESLLWLRGTE